MAIGISVAGDALLGYIVTVTDADQGTYVNVYREDQTGYYDDARVRGLDYANPTGDTMVVIDYEAPFNVDLRYIAEAYAVDDLETPIASATSGIVGTTLPGGFAIISDPLDNTQRMAVGIEDMGDWEFEAKVLGRHTVIGRKNSVINMDVESGRKGSFQVTNLNMHAVNWDGTGPYLPFDILHHANWRTLFANGRKLLFRNDAKRTGFDDMYFAVLGRRASPIGALAPQGQDPFLRYEIQYEEQDRPATTIIGSGFGDWDAVKASNVDWDEVFAQHGNWFSVLANPSL